MTAWAILIANSTVSDNSIAWLHLNSQQIGSGTVIIGGNLTANIEDLLSASTDDLLTSNISDDLDVNAEVELSVTTDQEILEAEICQV